MFEAFLGPRLAARDSLSEFAAELQRERDARRADQEELAVLREELARNREQIDEIRSSFGAQVQSVLLGVDTILPKHATDQQVKEARWVPLPADTLDSLVEEGILPEC
eukprot:SAG11_NODE_7689_length_1109_cov_3.090099_1_plen_107_part_10